MCWAGVKCATGIRGIAANVPRGRKERDRRFDAIHEQSPEQLASQEVMLQVLHVLPGVVPVA